MAYSADQAIRINKMGMAAERDGLGTEIKRLGDDLDTAEAAIDALETEVDGKQAALTDPLTLVAAPAAANSTGTKGQFAYDGTYVYLCTATDTWVRGTLALATWS